MKLDARTVSVLKNFNKINTNLVIRPGDVLTTLAATKTVYAKAVLNQKFEKDVAIYDLSRFLGTLSLFEDPEIEFGEKSLKIISGQNKVNYTYADPRVLVAPKKDGKTPELPSVDVEFELTPQQLSDVMKAKAVMKLEAIAFVGNDQGITFQTFDPKQPDADFFSVGITEDPVGNFRAIFNSDAFELMSETYLVQLSQQGLARFVTKDENLQYFVALSKDSEFVLAD